MINLLPATTSFATRLMAIAQEHACAGHPLFDALAKFETEPMTVEQGGRLLFNYDVHASHLRRLLLKAATIMPECAVGFILENVRNEYGNGRVDDRHQLQLQDLAFSIGVGKEAYKHYLVQPGIKKFIAAVTEYYYPAQGGKRRRAAVAAGAITATEILAMQEFVFLQRAFSPLGQKHHIWFNHVEVECEHTSESLDLALFFQEREDVEYGLKGVLDANLHLYDGLLASLETL